MQYTGTITSAVVPSTGTSTGTEIAPIIDFITGTVTITGTPE
jgi:hypothetical protein